MDKVSEMIQLVFHMSQVFQSPLFPVEDDAVNPYFTLKDPNPKVKCWIMLVSVSPSIDQKISSWWFHFFYFHLYLGKRSNLTNIFQMG